MKPLAIFPADMLPLSPRWEQWFREQGYVLESYDPQHPKEAEVLLLFTPIQCAGSWVNIESVWSHYFLKRNMNARLIQAGINGRESRPNYLHLYHLPSDFNAFAQTCKTVGQDWQPVSAGMTELSDRIRLFFEGHGNDGFWHWLAEVRRFLNFLPINQPGARVEEIRELLRDPVKHNQIDILKKRWTHYSAIFVCLPDQRFIPKVHTLLDDLQIRRIIEADDANLAGEILLARQRIEQITEQLEPLHSSILPESVSINAGET